MAERCPLLAGGLPSDIPDYCRDSCERLWDEAVRLNHKSGDYDVYRLPEDIDEEDFCRHDGTPLEFSTEGLQANGATALRFYSIVDACMRCEQEYGEQTYKFVCPNN